MSPWWELRLYNLPLSSHSLFVCLFLSTVFAASQTYWKMASKLKRTSLFGWECLRWGFLFFWCVCSGEDRLSDRNIFLYEQTCTEAVIREKSYCLCNTAMLQLHKQFYRQSFFCQTTDRHRVATSTNFEISRPTFRPLEINVLVQYSSDSSKCGFHWQSMLEV